MPALDRLHLAVVNALTKDGWTITDNPLTLKTRTRTLFVDLAAEKVIAAERGKEKIAVEIKVFGRNSLVADLQQAVGQYTVYEKVLARLQPERTLYLAIPQAVLETLRQDELGEIMLETSLTQIIAFSPEAEEVTEWITSPNTDT